MIHVVEVLLGVTVLLLAKWDQYVNGVSDDKEKGRQVLDFDPIFTWGVLYILIFLSTQNLWTLFMKKRCLITLTMPKAPLANEVTWGIEHQFYHVFFISFLFLLLPDCIDFYTTLHLDVLVSLHPDVKVFKYILIWLQRARNHPLYYNNRRSRINLH